MIRIREMASNEATQVKNLFEHTWVETFRAPAPPFEAATQGEQIYVALTDGNVVAFASIWEPDAFIHFLFVDRNVRRQGIARAMVEFLSQIYTQPLTLKCLKSNTDALTFYYATGWTQISSGCSADGEYVLLSR